MRPVPMSRAGHNPARPRHKSLSQSRMHILTQADSKDQAGHTAYLDARGLNCPLPILKTKLLLNKMAPAEVLLVEATDPHSRVDFEAYCARTGHRIIKFKEAGQLFSFLIERAANPKKI